MADCCYIINKKPKRKRRKLFKLAIIFLVITALLLSYFFIRVSPIMLSVIEEKTRMLISASIDECASELISDLNYDDYIIKK